jgi:hypothetical protein
LAKATPTAGIVPGLTAKKLQPYKTQSTYKPFYKTYCHRLWEHSTQFSTYLSNYGNYTCKHHMAISHPAEPTWRTISELTINIPEPIMDPRPAWFHQIILVLKSSVSLHNQILVLVFEWLYTFCEIDYSYFSFGRVLVAERFLSSQNQLLATRSGYAAISRKTGGFTLPRESK